MNLFKNALLLTTLIAGTSTLPAWDHAGHRTVNLVALQSLPADFPSFVKSPENISRIDWLASEPDRLRSTIENALKNQNHPEHYLDHEDAADAGFPISTLPAFRYDFITAGEKARLAHPDLFPPVPANKNKDGTAHLPGTIPWAIAENQAKLQTAFSHLKTLLKNKAPQDQLQPLQDYIVFLMGNMGHYIGDACQPLHMTKHHHGWVGDNPKNYSTDKKVHEWLDSGFFKQSAFKPESLFPQVRPATLIPLSADCPDSPLFPTILQWLQQQAAQVEPTYDLIKSGDLGGTPTATARNFITNQLLSGGQMLADLWLTAWRNSAPLENPPPPQTLQFTIARLAIASLPSTFPAFAVTPQAINNIAGTSTEPLLFLHSPNPALRHASLPEATFKYDLILAASIDVTQVSDLRNRFVAEYSALRESNPDILKTHSLPGLLPWAILEAEARINSALSYLKAYIEHGGTTEEIRNSRANVIYYMGILAYHVAEASRPSHLSSQFLSTTTGAPPENDFLIDAQTIRRLTPKLTTASPFSIPRAKEKYNEPARRSPLLPMIFFWIHKQYDYLPEFTRLYTAGSFTPGSPNSLDAQKFTDAQILRASAFLSTLYQTAYAEVTPDAFLIKVLKSRK